MNQAFRHRILKQIAVPEFVDEFSAHVPGLFRPGQPG